MLKNTKTRKCVLQLLDKFQTPMSANDIFNSLEAEGITLSSIYRTLEAFTKENIVIKDTDTKGTAIYTIQKDDHCHYLECKNCHKKIKLDYCPYHKANDKISKAYNFEADENNIIIYGTCKDCKHKKSTR